MSAAARAELAEQLAADLQAGQLPDMAALQQPLRARSRACCRNVVVHLAPLNAYEALIGASLDGRRGMKHEQR